MSTTTTVRESNFELLRIIAMAMLVIHHFIVHILWPAQPAGENFLPVLTGMNVFFVVGVNLFVMISGYFQIKLTWRSLIKLWLFVLFFTAVTLIGYEVYALQHGMAGLSWTTMLLPFGLFSRGDYWFISCYFILMLFSPIFNAALRAMSLSTLRRCILLVTFFTCYSGFLLGNTNNPAGHNVLQFFYLYLLGHYIRQEPLIKNIPRNVFLIAFFGITLAYGLTAALLTVRGFFIGYDMRIFALNNPVIILTAICLFCYFSRLSIRSRIINRAAASMLGVYILQESKLGYVLYGKLSQLWGQEGFSFSFLCILAGVFAGLFVLAILLDQIRKPICDPLSRYLSSRIPKKLQLDFDEHH